jgi:hypothetical protein
MVAEILTSLGDSQPFDRESTRAPLRKKSYEKIGSFSMARAVEIPIQPSPATRQRRGICKSHRRAGAQFFPDGRRPARPRRTPPISRRGRCFTRHHDALRENADRAGIGARVAPLSWLRLGSVRGRRLRTPRRPLPPSALARPPRRSNSGRTSRNIQLQKESAARRDPRVSFPKCQTLWRQNLRIFFQQKHRQFINRQPVKWRCGSWNVGFQFRKAHFSRSVHGRP